MATAAVIPAYNESATIGGVVREARKHADYVIVVDDGSGDNTSESARKAGAITLRHIVNLGKGSAMKTGCEKALRLPVDYIVFLDADAQHNPADIPKVVRFLEKKKMGLVVGSRPLDHHMPLMLKFGNWGIHATMKSLFGIKIKDTQSGFRAFKRADYDKIKWTSTNYAVETEMLINAMRRGLEVGEMPIDTVYVNKHKGTTVIDGMRIFLQMFWFRLR